MTDTATTLLTREEALRGAAAFIARELSDRRLDRLSQVLAALAECTQPDDDRVELLTLARHAREQAEDVRTLRRHVRQTVAGITESREEETR